MKELIRFSLLRRFNNKSTKMFNLIIFIVIGAAAFSDLIINFINPQLLEKEIIYVDKVEEGLLTYLNTSAKEEYIFKVLKQDIKKIVDSGSMVLEKKKDKYVIHSKYELGKPTLYSFEMYLNQYRKDQLMNNMENIEIINEYNKQINIKNNVKEKKVDISQEKSSIIFMFVTSVYFMMLSFVSGVASEVVNEKSTKTLELILTSVSAKTHFYSKLIVGWLVIVIQGIASISYILFWLLIRSVYDQGRGLLFFINEVGLFSLKGNNFYSLISNFDISYGFILKFLYTLIFLLIGILLIQLVLVIVSSFVSSIEEAGNIQAPFYLLLLGFYYLTLALNNPYDLSEGIGYYLSFVPFMNMLLMPCRILIQEVPFFQLVISISISIYAIAFIIIKGSEVYERGVLDYSCKGFIQVLKSMRKNKKTGL